MIDKGILEAMGVSVAKWKTLLTLPAPKKAKGGRMPVVKYGNEKLDALQERIRARCVSGRDYCTKNFRTIRACDLIWDAPYRQVSPTLLWNIAETSKTTEEAEKALTMFGFDLNQSFTVDLDPKTGKEIKKLNVPMFFAITIPLVHGMLSMRKAKIVNDRNKQYFFDYPPAVNTRKNRLKCSAVKSRMRVMSQQYNYLATLDQAVHQMLLYPQGALLFTQENWHWEEQLRQKGKKKTADSKPAKKKKGDPDNYEKYVSKEGLRYFLPHPSRVFWDRAHPVRTFNTETGCDWGGHWKVLPFKELQKNKDLWNLETVSMGDVSWWTDNTSFLNIFFNNCVINAPSAANMPPTGRGNLDRENAIREGNYYSIADADKSVVTYEYRERIIPKDEGLGDYEYPIWARFMCAGDGTIVYAEPLCYRAILSLRDNGDESKVEDASMGLKLAPFQDQLSNLISQYILSVKQNLAQYTLIDENILDKKSIEKLKNLGEGFFRTLNLQTFDGKKTHRQRDNIGAAIYSHRFPQIDTQSILTAARTVIALAERVNNFSSQEVGQAASHEQSRAEIVSLGGTTTNALQYIGIPVDAFMHAWGYQVYEAWMNEGEDDFTAEIPYEEDVDKAVLEEIGFSFVEEPERSAGRAHVKGKASKVLSDLLSFSLLPNSGDEATDGETARVLSEWSRDLLNNPITAQALGPDQAIALANAIAKLLKLPLDVPLKNTGLTPEKQAEQAKAQLKQLVDQVKEQFAKEVEVKILTEVKDGIVPMLKKDEELTQKVDLIWQLLKLPPINGPTDPSQPGAANSGTSPGAPGMAAPAGIPGSMPDPALQVA